MDQESEIFGSSPPSSGWNKFLFTWSSIATMVATGLGLWQYHTVASNDDLLVQLETIVETLEGDGRVPVPEGQVAEAAEASILVARQLVRYALAEGELEIGEVYLISEGGVTVPLHGAVELISPAGKLTTIAVNQINKGWVHARVDGSRKTLYVGEVENSSTDMDCRYIDLDRCREANRYVSA